MGIPFYSSLPLFDFSLLARRNAGGPPAGRDSVTIGAMANLILVYGMRLLPAEDIETIGDAPIKLKHGREARVTMHVLEGSKESIEAQLRTSVESFFDMYPDI